MKKRILSFLLAMVMIFGMMPVAAFATDAETPEVILCETEGCEYAAGHEGNCSNYVAPKETCATEGCTFDAGHEGNCSNYVEPVMMMAVAPASVEDGVIYQNGTDGSAWPTAAGYVNTLTLTGATISSYAWNGNECNVVLAADTASDASITFTIAMTGQPAFVNASAVTIDGTVQSSRKGTVKLTGGEKTVDIKVDVRGTAVTKTFKVSVAGGGVKNDPPSLKEGVEATVSAVAYTGCPYNVNLTDIFMDADGNDLSYTVKIGKASAVAAAANFTYTPEEAGSQTLVFTANDGKLDSSTYTVNLTVLPSDLTLDKNEVEVEIGKTLTLNATVSPETAELVWTSSDPSVATVENGVVTPIKEGITEITVSAAGKSQKCTVSVVDPSILRAKVTMTINNQGVLELIREPVTVLDQDNDGTLTFHDALVTIHNAYGKSYIAEDSAFGLFVTTMWDVYTGGSNYFLIDNVPLAYSVGTDTVKNGDNLYATNMVDLYGFSDVYTHFGTATKTVTAGEEFDLTLYALAMNWETYNRESVPAGNISVGTYSGYSGGSYTSLGQKTDANGKVTLAFAEPGTYIVSATGNYADAYGMESPIMPPLCIITVKEATVEKVELGASALTMTINTTGKLTATVTPANAVNKTLTWTSSDSSVVSVDKNGNLNAKKEGTATITATAPNGKKATCVVTVELAEPAADAVVSMTIGNRGVLALVNAPVTVKDLNSDGILTYDEALNAAHTAYFDGENGFAINQDSGWVYKLWGVESSNLLFFKNDKPIPEFTNSRSSVVKTGDALYATILMYESVYKDVYAAFDQKTVVTKTGQQLELVLTGYLGAHNGQNPTWSPVSDAAVGTWSDGEFTAMEGKTTDAGGKITLTFEDAGTYVVSAYKNDTSAPLIAPVCVVTVETAAIEETIALDVSELSLSVGDEQTLTATVTPEDAEITWFSSDSAVAKVENGKVTALKEGTATITAKVGSKEATCLVTVQKAAVEYLSALKFTAGTSATAAEYEMQPAFDPGVKEYTLVVPDSKTTVAVWATLAADQSGTIKAVYKNTSNASKSVTVTSAKTTGASLSSVLKTGFGGNTVTITVGGEEAYSVTIVRKATLGSLALSSGTDYTAVLDPAFNAEKTEYNAKIPYDKPVTVEAKGKYTGSVVTINGEANTEITPVWTELKSEIEIVVTGGSANPDVYPTTYKVKLDQCATSIEIQTPPTKTEYKAGDKFDATGMTLKATYSDGTTAIIEKGSYTYTPDGAMDPGVSEIEVSYDGLSVKQAITMAADFEGTGTQDDPYLMKTADNLVRLSEMVESGVSFEGMYIKMVNDITLPADWEPLGSSKTKPFSGNFDGGNNLLTVPEDGLPLIGTPIGATLSNLNIYGSKIAGYGVVNNYTQISAVTKSIIVIDNVALKSGTQTLKSGFIGGYASGQDVVTIQNCTVESGVVIGYDKQQSNIGSFGGEFNGTISNCVSYADVYGVDYVGGIVATKGQTMGDFVITNCQFRGSVTGNNYVGGIVAHGYAGGSAYGINTAPNAPIVTIQNCSCSAAVSGNSYVGGILGAERASAQVWDNGIGYIQNNSFTGTVSGSSYVGGIVGYIRSLNKYTEITNNYYAASSGASVGIGGVEYVDTNCQTHETASGATYLNTENGTTDCPSITGCAWRKAHNRTDDPLGADAAKLCYTDTQTAPVAVRLQISGTYKTEYIAGDALDLTGMMLTVVYNDDSTEAVSLEDATVSGYDKETIGEQSITVSYAGLTANVKITVKNKEEKLTVTVTVLGDYVHDSDKDGVVHTLAAGNLTTWVSATTVTVDSNATAWDAIQQVLNSKGLSCGYSYNATYGSVYIESVNGLGEFTNGKDSGWKYTVNGAYPAVGVSAYYLKNGDKILLHYTDNYKKESDGWDDTDLDMEPVEKVISLIDAIGTVTLNSKEKIEAARKAYDALSYAQKQKVENYKKLTDAENKLADLQKEEDKKLAQKVMNMIDDLDSKSATFEKDVEAAKKAYDALTADQKKLVTNYSKLTDALKELASQEDKEAAEAVEKLINAIGTVTKDCEDKIKTAREAYDKLTADQKALVENIAVLEAAEEKLTKLKEAAAGLDIYNTTGDYLENLGSPVPGSIGGEWMVVGLLRSGRKVKDIDAYYDAAVKFVQDNIDENSRLHKAKSTENSRMILALTAMGKDVTNVGGHNLLTGLNNMEYVQKQGINGPIWALIALDSGNYPAPEGDVTREALIQVILDEQLADGGWALSGSTSDPDMTGMALQALAPYYATNAEVKKSVDEAIKTLSMMQAADGSFASIDGSSSESVAQVVAALSALGIDANTDARFIKNGVSALEALCAFYVEGGGFKHIPDGKLDGMATEQSYYALAAYFRMLEGKTSLFNMTDVIDMGGDKVEEEPAETAPAVTEPAPTEPAVEKVAAKGSFPWWLVIVIVVLAGSIVVLVIVSKPKKGKYNK